MAAPTVYRWDDGNAPVARGERRSLCDILFACLVTGYGTKQGAGWTREYVNATFDKAAFRNSPVTGTGFYLQVDGLGAANAYQSKVQGFEAMTSENNGLFPFTPGALNPIETSNAAGTTARPWILIADDRAFWFSCWTSSTTTPGNSDIGKSELFFGDIIKYKPDDAYASMLMASYSQYGHYVGMAGPDGTIGTGKGMPRKLDGLATPVVPALIRGGGPGMDSIPGGAGMAYTPGGPLLITRPHINDGAAYTIRGWLPGYWYTCHSYTAFGQLAPIVADGKSFIHIRGYVAGGNLGAYLISLDDWRA